MRHEGRVATVRAADEDPTTLISALYDAVLEPALLPRAMSAIGRWMDSDALHLIGWDTARFVPRIAVVDEGAMDHVDPAYVSHYSQIDPRRARMAEVPTGQVATCAQYFDDGFVRRNAFFQEFLLPRGRRHTLGAHLHRDTHLDFYVTFYHSVGRDTFSADQIDKARWMVPHLQRAVRLLHRQARLGSAAEQGMQALDRLDHGVVVLDPRGDVLLLNRRADALLREGHWLRTSGGGRCLRPAVGSPGLLVDMVNRVAITGVPECRVLRRPSDSDTAHWCSLSLSRLPAGTDLSWHRREGRAALLLLIDVPQRQRRPAAPQLMQMFGFTQAEARLAQALVQGQSADAYAQCARVSMPTVRTQIRALLDKTGTARQQDMIRLLATLPSVRSPVGE